MQKNLTEYNMAQKYDKRTKRMKTMHKLNKINITKNAPATGGVALHSVVAP